MIKLVPVEEKYMSCNCCDSHDDVKELKFIRDEGRFTTTFQLCWLCRTELYHKLADDVGEPNDH